MDPHSQARRTRLILGRAGLGLAPETQKMVMARLHAVLLLGVSSFKQTGLLGFYTMAQSQRGNLPFTNAITDLVLIQIIYSLERIQ